jgi:hypothetical protein
MPAAHGSAGFRLCEISRQGGEMSKMTKTSYLTPEAAALGGFRRILLSHSRWTDVEFGFLVLEVKSEVVKQLGHEGFISIEKRYHYTEPETDNTKDAIEVKVPVYELPSLRAFCHTHPTNGGFSSHDFETFKKLSRVIKDKNLKQELVFYLMSVNQQVRQSSTEEDFMPGTNVTGLEKAMP